MLASEIVFRVTSTAFHGVSAVSIGTAANAHGPFARESLVCCSFPLATIVVLLAAKYKTMEAESASAVLLSTLSLVVTVPIIVAISQ